MLDAVGTKNTASSTRVRNPGTALELDGSWAPTQTAARSSLGWNRFRNGASASDLPNLLPLPRLIAGSHRRAPRS